MWENLRREVFVELIIEKFCGSKGEGGQVRGKEVKGHKHSAGLVEFEVLKEASRSTCVYGI